MTQLHQPVHSVRSPAGTPGYRWVAGLAAFFFVFAVWSASLPAPTPVDPWFSVRVWQAEDGLPENRVVGVVQAPDGYLWVASQVGLVRFDGVRFQPAELVGGDTLFSGTMWGLVRDRTGCLWLAKEGGVLVSVAGEQVRVLTPRDGLPQNETQRSMAIDGAGAVWVTYTTGKVIRYQSGRVDSFGGPEGLPEVGVCWLASGHDGKLWFAKNRRIGFFRAGSFHVLHDVHTPAVRITPASAGGIWICAGSRVMRLDDDGKVFPLGEFVPSGNPNHVAADPTVVLEDQSGAVWVGTAASGLFRFDSAGVVRVETSHPGILSLAEDQENNMWVGTRGGGLNRVHRRVTSLVNSTAGLPVEGVQSICRDASGALWVVGQNGVLARRTASGWTNLSPRIGTPLYMNCVTADTNGSVWVGTRGGSIYRWRDGEFTNAGLRDKLSEKAVRALMVSTTGDLWIGTDRPDAVYRLRVEGMRLRKFDLPPGYRFVRALAEDPSGAIWAGASDGLLVRISGDIVTEESAIAGRRSIRCLHAAANGDLWIGSAGFGVGRRRGGQVSWFAQAQGIPNNFVSQILTDNRGSVWFAGNQGIFQVREREFDDVAEGRRVRVTPAVYGRNEDMFGLQASFDYHPSSLHSGDGLFFTMLTGVAEVRLEQARANPVPPKVYIERLIADGQALSVYPNLTFIPEAPGTNVAPTETPSRRMELQLPPGRQLVQFEFAVLSFIAPERSRFRYKLEGLDHGWVEAGSRRIAEYTHPPPGHYRFRVIACNNDGVWNEVGDSLDVILAPFLWESVWFKLAVTLASFVALCGLVVFILFRRHRREVEHLERQRELEAERTRIARDLHDDLGVGLTEIGLLGDLAGTSGHLPEPGRERLREITGRARMLAASLDEIVWAINPANDTSQSLVDYFFPYAQRLLGQAGVRCRLQVIEPLPEGSLNAEVRHEFFHAYKEALNNIIRHAGAKQVQVILSGTERFLSIVIADDGCGIQEADRKGGHHGLTGMRDRLLLLGGRLGITDTPGGGTTITFMIPVQPEVKA